MRVTLLLSIVGVLFLQPSSSADESLKGMTYNLRYASNSKPNAWPDRLPVMGELINKTDPDIIGTQEGKFYQLKELNKKIPQYTWFGTGRDGGSRGIWVGCGGEEGGGHTGAAARRAGSKPGEMPDGHLQRRRSGTRGRRGLWWRPTWRCLIMVAVRRRRRKHTP